MPPSESLPVRVVLTVEVDGHVLTFEETGKATGARYHGADPRKSGLAVDEVLAAARDYAARLHSGLFQILTPAERLCRAVRALDTLDGPGGAT